MIEKVGSTNDGEGFVQKLWQEANSHFNEVADLAMKDSDGNYVGFWEIESIHKKNIADSINVEYHKFMNNKKLFTILFFLLTVFYAFSNDTYFYYSIGGITPVEEGNISVRMQEEVIQLVLNPDYFEVTVDFDFYNDGEEVELLVGFPFFEIGAGHSKIFDFRCWTNNQETDYTEILFDRSYNKYPNEFEIQLEFANTRKITFPKNEVTKTRINYKSYYGSDGWGKIVRYLYGTGSSWKDSIGKMTVIMENNLSLNYPWYITMPNGKSSLERIADNKWAYTFYNIEPNYTDCIYFYMENIWKHEGHKAFPSRGYFARDRKITRSELFWYTKSQLRILRNTIYALHGYDFKSQDLKDFFSRVYWAPPYKVNPNFSEDLLTDIEKANAKTFLEEEQSR